MACSGKRGILGELFYLHYLISWPNSIFAEADSVDLVCNTVKDKSRLHHRTAGMTSKVSSRCK